jgi:hypothetical protein
MESQKILFIILYGKYSCALTFESLVKAIPHGSGLSSADRGYSVVCVVDGLNDEQVDVMNELVESLHTQVLVNLGRNFSKVSGIVDLIYIVTVLGH